MSVGSTAAGLMVRSTNSPPPVTVAFTRPPPAVPSTLVSASSCWAVINSACIRWACMRIWPMSGPGICGFDMSMSLRPGSDAPMCR